MSRMRSSSAVASGRPAPRYARVGVVFVTAACHVELDLRDRYTPCAIVRVKNGRNAPIAGYAPASAMARTRKPMIVPSRFRPISTCCTWPRPCAIATMFSERVSVHFTGPAEHAARPCATMRYSTYMPALAPKPPPTAGATTRTLRGVEPEHAGERRPARRAEPGSGPRRVSPPSGSPGTATMPFGSIGTAATRWLYDPPRHHDVGVVEDASTGAEVDLDREVRAVLLEDERRAVGERGFGVDHRRAAGRSRR